MQCFSSGMSISTSIQFLIMSLANHQDHHDWGGEGARRVCGVWSYIQADIGKTTQTKFNEQDLEPTKKTPLWRNQWIGKALEELEELKPLCIDIGMSYAERAEREKFVSDFSGNCEKTKKKEWASHKEMRDQEMLALAEWQQCLQVIHEDSYPWCSCTRRWIR